MKSYRDEQRLKPIDVPCMRCGAPSGRVCLPLALFDEASFGGHHLTRDHDAKLASKAADVMDPKPRPWRWYAGVSIVSSLRQSLLVDTVS